MTQPALYCHAVMARRWWAVPVLASSALLVLATGLAVRDVKRYEARVLAALHTSCLRRTLALEASAETWIVRDDLESLRAAAKLLLMGSGLYADVVVRGELVVSDADADASVHPIDPAAAPPREPLLRTNADGTLEVLAPILLAGHPDDPIGVLRIGYSNAFAVETVRRRGLFAALIAGGGWILCGVSMATVVFWHRRRCSRTERGDAAVIHCGPLTIDRRGCTASFADRPIDLTPKLFELLTVFAESPGEVFSDEELLRRIWSDSAYAASADVKQHIYLLRRKMGTVHPDPKALIENVKGFGYRLVCENEKELRGR